MRRIGFCREDVREEDVEKMSRRRFCREDT